MKASHYSAECERIVAEAMRPIASELRLVEAADLIALLRFEKHADLAELVSESAELYYMPGTVLLGSGGDYHLEWRGEPRIALDLELKLPGVSVYLRLVLQDETGGIEIEHIHFDDPSTEESENTAFLSEMLRRATFVPAPRRLSA